MDYAKIGYFFAKPITMYRPFCFVAILAILLPSWATAQIKSPDAFLPHRLGEQFTPHEMQVEYLRHLAANSKNLVLRPYGLTNEKRPLQLAFVSSEANLAKLEDIRLNNLRRAGLVPGAPDPALAVGIIWLSYSVHGNEAAGAESAMKVLYELLNPANTQAQQWLANTLVIIDPCINPDGYSRYTHWYRGISSDAPSPNPLSRDHQEPWPGGRVNHYYFDLNRDWAWQTQVESQQRLRVYNDWLPHIHVDVHEQGYNAPYYFAPAAQPYHRFITPWQREFQETIGKSNAKYFAQNGWLFFTKEVFDLLYPSYGDTYPTYNGAIGMTYEQGGIGAGRAVIMTNGDTLTLADRIAHHYTTSMSTIEVAATHTAALLKNFTEFFERARNNPPGAFKTYVIKGTNAPERLKSFSQILDANRIRYGKAGKTSALNAYNYQTGATATLKVEPNDLIVSAYQPRGTMAQILLDPAPEVVDSNTYDITAWSLPYAYGLETYAGAQRLDPAEEGYAFPPYSNNLGRSTAPYAYLAPWRGLANAKFLAAVLKKGIKVRYATTSFTLEGAAYPAGTLVLTAADNRKLGSAFHDQVAALAQQQQQAIQAVAGGLVESGRDFGSSSYRFIRKPEVAVLFGEQTYNNEFGQVWHYFDRDLGYPTTMLDAGRLERTDLSRFNVLVMPEGRYRLPEAVLEKISAWVNAGGRLLAIGDALNALSDRKGFALTPFATDDAKKQADRAAEDVALKGRFLDYAGQDRRDISTQIPGAIFKTKLDNTHPLAYGQGDTYFSLKTGAASFQPLKNLWNVATIGDQLQVAGFAGAKARQAMKNSLVFGVEEKGAGQVVYFVDNPLFRGFWENGKFLFSNAVFFVGN